MKGTILIVDDNATNRKLAGEVLAYDGFGVAHAGCADEALAAISQRRPDLILMDIALPGMDGLTLTRQLKRDIATARIPVVALTAFAMKGDDRKAEAAGCDGYIGKPIDTRTLSRQVEHFLAAARTKDPSASP
jgi:CheY-like chemotaxis protein